MRILAFERALIYLYSSSAQLAFTKSSQKSDYWMADKGQAILLGKLNDRTSPPTGLCAFDYAEESKALLYAAGDAEEGEWIEVELCANTGACDTVIPRKLRASIPIQPSLQSQCMEYEVADGHTILNLGERRCMMWIDSAVEGRKINLQVADVHTALWSLSRCADIGFESRFVRTSTRPRTKSSCSRGRGICTSSDAGLRLRLSAGRKFGDDDAAPLCGQ